MSGLAHYEANAEQLQQVHGLTDEQALKLSYELSATHIAEVAFYQNRNGNMGYKDPLAAERNLDIGRVAYELNLRLVDEPTPSDEYLIGPYCIEARDVVIRGIAVWRRNPEGLMIE